jgi:hypothetical protein
VYAVHSTDYYIKEQKLKKQKEGEKTNKKHTFNSPTLKNKENIKN